MMILGSDQRFGDKKLGIKPRSDTIILVRLDPDKEATAVMSIPRDLKVDIPGYGKDRVNSAYELGGPRLTVKTVKKLFSDAGQADQDQPHHQRRLRRLPQGRQLHRRRLRRHRPRLLQRQLGRRELRHDRRQPGLPEAQGPGRARLRPLPPRRQRPRARGAPAGLPAPAAQRRGRPQAARLPAPPPARDDLRPLHRHRQGPAAQVGHLLAAQARPLHGPQAGPRGPLPDQPRQRSGLPDRLEGQARQDGVSEFLNAQASKKPRQTSRATDGRPQVRRQPQEAQPRRRPCRASRSPGARARTRRSSASGGPTSRSTSRRCATTARATRARSRASTASATSARSSTAPTASSSPRASIGEYYGIQGTTWREPPILDDPSETRKVNGRKLELHYDGRRLRLVAWRTKRAVYWVSNTLTQSLSTRQMIAIAASLRRLGQK